MAATRMGRKATRKAPVRRKKPVARPRVKARAKSSGRGAAVKARVGLARAAVPAALRSPASAEGALNGAANEEQRIESSKYLPRHAPKRLFETERFVFPESYGVNRVRLLVKDPEWLFAHWDVDPAVLASLRTDLGERALALSRLTLRLSESVEGGSTVILLPKSARGFYIRADGAARSYQAELGLTLPSGEFRPLAASNTVGTPRVGPSPEPARIRVQFHRGGQHVVEAALAFGTVHATAEEAVPRKPAAGAAKGAPARESAARRPGGASDTYRR